MKRILGATLLLALGQAVPAVAGDVKIVIGGSSCHRPVYRYPVCGTPVYRVVPRYDCRPRYVVPYCPPVTRYSTRGGFYAAPVYRTPFYGGSHHYSYGGKCR